MMELIRRGCGLFSMWVTWGWDSRHLDLITVWCHIEQVQQTIKMYLMWLHAQFLIFRPPQRVCIVIHHATGLLSPEEVITNIRTCLLSPVEEVIANIKAQVIILGVHLAMPMLPSIG